ncbi:NAD(P)H-quinone oxidoreductase [Pleomorphovibrio marinus]|uniref:NAD(P)H-quinone oxidoreductase n=1 Tax=Pleomorphovibrio marinus TaxID=2164132 RepID=UPI000E0AED24|nr:NAD(P)H-quinone oxidoreductase [Pleomorphovibrio marinus]
MKAIIIPHPGGPEVLQLRESNLPPLQSNEVKIRVAAAGVNRPDVAQRKGNYPPPPGAPQDIPGLEISGTITELGESVKNWEVGDQVCALVSGGGYATQINVPEEQCLVIPEGVSVLEAAALPETFFTVWNNVFDIGKFRAGERVLVHGGSSGIGVAAIQMVKGMGGKAYVTAGTEDKCNFCSRLGADQAINYNTEDFEQVLRDKGIKLDIVLDMIGASYTPKNLKLLNQNGRLIMINTMGGKDSNVDLRRVMVKKLTITGSTLRPQSSAYKAKIAKALMAEIWPFFPDKIKPVIHKVFPLAQAADAHALMESSAHIGKILLNCEE